jgi:branched-chain amino acid transport system ATP-binding protein
VAILGANGAGKSSIFRAISRLVGYEGSVCLNGELLSGTPEDVVRRGVAHVLEGRHVFAHLTVAENLKVSRFATSKSEWDNRFVTVVDCFPLLKPLMKRRGAELSGGQQQALAIARGLLTAPDILLLDEPSLGLAPIVVEQLVNSIATLREHWHTTVLISEQNLQVSVATCDRVYILRRGTVVHEGRADDAELLSELIHNYLG